MTLETGSRRAEHGPGRPEGAPHPGGLPISHLPSPISHARSAFTLVEIVIALTIIALLTAIAIPAVSGLRNESIAREPVAQLVDLAKQVRARAMAEGRPYQITFDSTGFRATRFWSPYAEDFEIDDFLVEAGLRRDEERASDAAYRQDVVEDTLNAAARRPDWVDGDEFDLAYELPEDVEITVHFWGQPEPEVLESPEGPRSWVFQPSGISNPLRVAFESGNSTFAVTFNALTADIDREQSYVQ